MEVLGWDVQVFMQIVRRVGEVRAFLVSALMLDVDVGGRRMSEVSDLLTTNWAAHWHLHVLQLQLHQVISIE